MPSKQEEAIDHAVWDTADYHPEDRFDAWVETLGPNFEMTPVDRDDRSFDARVSLWRGGCAAFGTLDFNHVTGKPVAARFHKSDRECVVLRYYEKNSPIIAVGGESVDSSEYDVQLFDPAEEVVICGGGYRMLAVYMPYDRIGYDPGRHPHHIRIAAHSSAGRFISGMLRATIEALPSATKDEAAVYADHFNSIIKSLVVGVKLEDDERLSARDARLSMISRFIHRNIHDPSLSAQKIATHHNMSRASLYRIFDGYGGIHNYIQSKRLKLAFEALAYGPRRRGRITSVATQYCFFDLSGFQKAFQAHFGVSPSSIVGERNSDAMNFTTESWIRAGLRGKSFEGIGCKSDRRRYLCD